MKSAAATNTLDSGLPAGGVLRRRDTLPVGAGVALHQLAATICGPIDWRDESTGFCRCPGEYLHGNPTGTHDCIVYLDGAPTIFCFHQSCAAVVADANYKLRSATGRTMSTIVDKPRLTPEQAQRLREKHLKVTLKARAAASLSDIKRSYAWPAADIFDESPIRLYREPAFDWRLHLTLFKADDIIWIGDVKDTGQPRHAAHFRPMMDWQTSKSAPGAFTCPATFKPGTFSRCNEAVSQRRYLVVESDDLSKTEMGAVIRWCRQFMRLRAIVDTGGKSLHGWFEFPAADVLAELQVILPALKCDPALFRAAQPCRLAGMRRGENWQHLLWFDGGDL